MMNMDLLELDELSLFMGEELKGGLFGLTEGDEVSNRETEVEKCILGAAQFSDIQSKIHDDQYKDGILDWMESFDLSTCLGDVIGLDAVQNCPDTTETGQELTIIHTLPLPGSDLAQIENVEVEYATPDEKIEVQHILGVDDLSMHVQALLNDSGIDVLAELESIGTNSSTSEDFSDISLELKSEPASPCSSVSSKELRNVPSLLQMHLESDLEIKPKSKSYTEARDKPYTKSTKGRKASKTPNLDDIPLEMLSKKDRKRIQNKNAAIKYRQKKKLEEHGIGADLSQLESHNEELHEKVDHLSREISYMKDLIKEIQKARGVLK